MHAFRTSVVLVSAAVLLAGCGSDQATPTTTSPEEPSRTAAVATSGEAVTPLDGTWRAGPISPADAEAALRRHGLAKWIEPFGPVKPFAGRTTLILDLKEGEWDLYGESAGASRAEIDYDAEFVVDGDTVDKIHATGTTTYRWAVDGDTLTFEWLESTEPAYGGVPDEVFSTALYMTSEFTRQG